jgi:hypothetical protein
MVPFKCSARVVVKDGFASTRPSQFPSGNTDQQTICVLIGTVAATDFADRRSKRGCRSLTEIVDDPQVPCPGPRSGTYSAHLVAFSPGRAVGAAQGSPEVWREDPRRLQLPDACRAREGALPLSRRAIHRPQDRSRQCSDRPGAAPAMAGLSRTTSQIGRRLRRGAPLGKSMSG